MALPVQRVKPRTRASLAAPTPHAPFPDGIDRRNLTGRGALLLKLPWLPLGVLAALLAAAMLGTFGGGATPISRQQGVGGSLTVEAPGTLRNGVFFEMRLIGTADRPLAKPTLAISSSYWRDITVNTMVPAPATETFDKGYYLFEFDPLEAGGSIEVKIAGQVNPTFTGGTRGAAQWRDGDAVLAEIPLRLWVLP